MSPTLKESARPLRTVLFVPGDDDAAVEAAPHHGSDAVVIDIEEPRTPFHEHEREAARTRVARHLEAQPRGKGPKHFVRIQSLATGYTLRDLRAVAHENLSGVLIPKVRTARDIVAVEALIDAVEVEAGLERGTIAIYPVLETAQGLQNAYEIAAASDRVAYMGGAVSRYGDIYQALRFRWSPAGLETLYLRSKVLMDARAAGIRYPISGMWGGRIDDLEGLATWANHLRDLGYFGMMLSKPPHVELVNEVFTPRPEDVAYWQDLDRLTKEAEAAGEGQVIYGDPNESEGHIVHEAHVVSARADLVWAEELGLLDR